MINLDTIDGKTYENDVVIDRGEICKRKKKPSKQFRDDFGHTPLSIEEKIPWKCHRNVAPVALNVNFQATTAGAGAVAPIVNTATIVPVGNICSGLRYMVVLFVNRNGYISGMTSASVVSYNGASNGFQLYVAHIPTGPANTIARICAITPAGQLNQIAGTGISNAGPYFWIQPALQYFIKQGAGFNLSNVPPGVTVADVVNGVQMSSLLINDNVTTTATFNFTDDYLKQTLNDVSNYFRKIQVPNSSDIFYSKSLRRMFYAADTLQSGWYC